MRKVLKEILQSAAVNKIKQTYCLQRFMLDWRHQHYKLVFFLTSSIVTMFNNANIMSA